MIRALVELVAAIVLGLVRDWRATRADRDQGRAEGAAETGAAIGSLASDQAENNLRDRGSARDVARRVRDKLARLAGRPG